MFGGQNPNLKTKMISNNTGVHKVENLFTIEELRQLEFAIDTAYLAGNFNTDSYLGRLKIEGLEIPQNIADKLTTLITQIAGRKVEMSIPPLFVEYDIKYGTPNLRPHFDGDFTEYVIDFQFSANTGWPLGVNLEVYRLEDNSAIIFNPNTNTHWRPEKEFKEGEHVGMIFFRFFYPDSPSDYSYLPNHPDHEVFKEVREFRAKLK